MPRVRKEGASGRFGQVAKTPATNPRNEWPRSTFPRRALREALESARFPGRLAVSVSSGKADMRDPQRLHGLVSKP